MVLIGLMLRFPDYVFLVQWRFLGCIDYCLWGIVDVILSLELTYLT